MTRNKYGAVKETEKQLLEKVRQVALLTGWRFYHSWNSMHSAKGFPDCCLAKKGKILFLELKTENGRLTPEQADWLDQLRFGCYMTRVIRPADFDWLVEELKR